MLRIDTGKLKHLSHTFVYYKDFFLMAEKLVLGFMAGSWFVMLNGLYNGLYGLAYKLCLRYLHQDLEQQKKVYTTVGILLLLGSIGYLISNSMILFSGKVFNYHEYLCLAIATFTFAELGINISRLRKIKKEENLMNIAITYINFSSICTSVVLTQNVLTALEGDQHSLGNGITALVFGFIMIITSIYMLSKRKCQN